MGNEVSYVLKHKKASEYNYAFGDYYPPIRKWEINTDGEFLNYSIKTNKFVNGDYAIQNTFVMNYDEYVEDKRQAEGKLKDLYPSLDAIIIGRDPAVFSGQSECDRVFFDFSFEYDDERNGILKLQDSHIQSSYSNADYILTYDDSEKYKKKTLLLKKPICVNEMKLSNRMFDYRSYSYTTDDTIDISLMIERISKMKNNDLGWNDGE